MPVTYDKIASITLSSNSSSFEFTSIPATYTDLIIVGNIGSTLGTGFAGIRYNGDTSSNYSNIGWYGGYTGSFPGTPIQGSGAYPNLSWAYIQINSATPSTIKAAFTIEVQNYKNTNIFKTAISKYNHGLQEVNMLGSLWRSTS
ncbi:hypothetical protein EBU71_21125, partial [bacterium]|nr:hypothetical protein [Candidatus Elulimicrobium humile]